MNAESSRALIRKLMAIYEDRPTTPEGLNALKQAKRLLAKYKIDHPKAPQEGAAPSREVARLFTAIQGLLNNKPQPRSQVTPDIWELERRLTQLLKDQQT